MEGLPDIKNMTELIFINSRQDMVFERLILPIVRQYDLKKIRRQNPRSGARMSENAMSCLDNSGVLSG